MIEIEYMKYMEDNLDMKVSELLTLIQEQSFHNKYFGVTAVKSPMDFWVYQEIISSIKPDVVVEVGNFHGGSTLGIAHMLDNIGKGKVVGVDIDHQNVPEIVKSHPRITLITGEACESFSKVQSLLKSDDVVLIIEDSSHTYRNTLNVLRTYSCLVSKGSYFIVEDSICHHGLDVGPDPGPYEAICNFVKENNDFEVDRSREQFFITWNPKGYLKRK